jgi:hypothetical protein
MKSSRIIVDFSTFFSHHNFSRVINFQDLILARIIYPSLILKRDRRFHCMFTFFQRNFRLEATEMVGVVRREADA